MTTEQRLNIVDGDSAGEILAKSGVAGEILVWKDILYEGWRKPGWPDDDSLRARASFLSSMTGRELAENQILETLRAQYKRLSALQPKATVVLWFDACLFDQSMLAHILTCLHFRRVELVELICIGEFPGIQPFHGLGQLNPKQIGSLSRQRESVTPAQYIFAKQVDAAFAEQDRRELQALSQLRDTPLEWVPPAAQRLLEEFPDSKSGLGRLERMALEAIHQGCENPADIYGAVAAAETPPQFWGDTTLWGKINGLADRNPPLVRIDGPAMRLPQWQTPLALAEFKVYGTSAAK